MPKKKVEKVKLTPEQERQAKLDSFINDRTEFLPEPTYSFKVGDRVEIGALEDVYVCDVISDKIYEIDYTSIDNNYGNPIRNEHQRRFVSWIDIRPFIEKQPNTFVKNKDVRLSYSQMQMGNIFSKAYYFGTNFDPEYQREYVWDMQDKVALIDSIFNNIDIGKFVFIHKGHGEKYTYEILDGKQRLRAILDYYENRFSYNGMYFNDLCVRDKYHFEGYSISVAEVRDADRATILKYFVMLNKQGRIMDKKQIEKVEKMIEELD